MSVLSAQTIRRLELIKPCLDPPAKDALGNSIGLSCCGYDLTTIGNLIIGPGAFLLAGAAEYFNLPPNVVGIVHDKSSLARKGLVVQNTVAEPGWRGYLTLELTNHGGSMLRFPKGCAIAQVVFHFLDQPTERPYEGKYQDQQLGPVGAKEDR